MNNLVERNLLNSKKIQGLPGWVACWGERNSHAESAFQLFYSDESKLPTIATDFDFVVLFQGFLQNHDEISRELSQGFIATQSDADIILAAYSKWGENILERLKGVFLLTVWDQKKNAFLAVRDRCGIYPFFYVDTGKDFFFSTSIEDLVRHPNVSSTMNRSAFVDWLSHRRPLPEETYYAEVKRILPGHAIRITKANRQVFRYWYSFPEDGQVEYLTDENAVDFDDVFEKAVGRCMQLGDSGIFLSGGLDSVSIASAAALLAERTGVAAPRGLSLQFPHPDCDEGEVQIAVAKALGIRHSLVRVDDILAGRGLLRSALDLAETWSQPMWNLWQPLYLHLGLNAKELGCDVIMTGAGGDEWLNVSDELAADYILRMDFRGLNRLVQALMRSHKLPKPAFLRHILWKNGVRLILSDFAKRAGRAMAPRLYKNYLRKRIHNMIPNWLVADAELREITDLRTEILVAKFMRKSRSKHAYGFYSRTFSAHMVDNVTSMEMEQLFEATQRTQVPVLHPYYDPELMHLLLRISPELLQRGGMEKGLVRESVARRFPNLQFQRKKKVTALKYWQSLVKEEGRVIWQQMGGPTSLIKMGIVDKKVLEPAMEEAFVSKSVWKNYKIWDLLCTEAWLRSKL